MSHYALFFVCLLFIDCKRKDHYTGHPHISVEKKSKFETVKDIALPGGYERLNLGKESFGDWLGAISLKKDDRVYLYDGSLKKNQSAQFAV
jgi:hypothetical protein